MINVENAIIIARNLASEKLGYDVQQRIWNRPTSAGGQLTYAFSSIKILCELFEKQKEHLATIEVMEQYQEIVRCAVDGDEQDGMAGLRKGLEQYARHQEFRRDPEKKIAAFTWLFELLSIITEGVQVVTVEEFKHLPYEKTFYDGKYFDRDYVFGELKRFCAEQILPAQTSSIA